MYRVVEHRSANGARRGRKKTGRTNAAKTLAAPRERLGSPIAEIQRKRLESTDPRRKRSIDTFGADA